jgi:DNA-binding ferritin-like protein
MSELGALLAILRAASHVHQSHHWQTRGGHFYGDHLLFMRIYEDSQTFIDQVAERAVGSGHAVLVSPSLQISSMGFLIQLWCGTPGVLGAEGMVEASLNVERCVVQCIGEARKSLEARGELSDGTDNLIQGAADKHEEFLYLLQQRGGKLEYSYDRTGL